jgi:nucleotide-binding universal stress UspA family protein
MADFAASEIVWVVYCMFKNVFIPVDLDDPTSSSKALSTAVAMARSSDTPLTLGTVIPDWKAVRDAQWSPLTYRDMHEQAEIRLRRIAADCGYALHNVLVGGGSVGAGIVDLAERAQADLIVLASHRPGLRDYLIGAHALHVVRHAKCSVCVVRN